MTAPVPLKSDAGQGLLKKQALSLLFLSAAGVVSAAPLDGFLTALPEQAIPKAYLEVGTDHMNAQLDFFKIRDTNALAAGTQAGDYDGAHVVGGWRVSDKVWLSGGYWQRNISGLAQTYHFNTWQVAGQYRLLQGAGKVPTLALHVSAWRNQASEVGATRICAAPVVNNPKVCQPDAFLNTATITDPADQSFQADVIGTWKLSPTLDLTAILGAGSTELSFGALTATTTRGGLDYQLSFIGNDIFGTTADGSTQFRDKASKYGLDLDNSLAWRGNFVQLGVNAAWNHGPWTLRGGYLFYSIQREAIDDILKSRGWSVVKQNKTVSLEAAYRLRPHMSVFARGQISSALIFNDMPVIYNAFSSDLVGGRYSIYTLGLRADF